MKLLLREERITSGKLTVPDRIARSKITWAVVAELLILLVCFLIRPDFFSIKYQPATGMLYGSLIDILNRSAEITIISMGMTLVIALGGTDLSVGSLVALSGALALKFLRWDVLVYNTPGDYTVKPFILVILVPLAVCTLMGLFNGFMISRIGMQPIIATLILMVCGRGIAQIVTNGKQYTTMYEPAGMDAPEGNCHLRGCDELSDRPQPLRSSVPCASLYISIQS